MTYYTIEVSGEAPAVGRVVDLMTRDGQLTLGTVLPNPIGALGRLAPSRAYQHGSISSLRGGCSSYAAWGEKYWGLVPRCGYRSPWSLSGDGTRGRAFFGTEGHCPLMLFSFLSLTSPELRIELSDVNGRYAWQNARLIHCSGRQFEPFPQARHSRLWGELIRAVVAGAGCTPLRAMASVAAYLATTGQGGLLVESGTSLTGARLPGIVVYDAAAAMHNECSGGGLLYDPADAAWQAPYYGRMDDMERGVVAMAGVLPREDARASACAAMLFAGLFLEGCVTGELFCDLGDEGRINHLAALEYRSRGAAARVAGAVRGRRGRRGRCKNT